MKLTNDIDKRYIVEYDLVPLVNDIAILFFDLIKDCLYSFANSTDWLLKTLRGNVQYRRPW